MTNIAFSSGSREIKQLTIHEPLDQPRLVLQIVHGMAEHGARYRRLAEALCTKGIAVAYYDQIGHGPDTPKDQLGYLGDYNGWQRMIYDVNTVHTILCQRWPSAKQVILGHSMGSFLLREYLIQFGLEQLDAAVVCSTGNMPPLAYRMGLWLAHLSCLMGNAKRPAKLIHKMVFGSSNRAFRPSRTAMDWLSRDEAEVDKYVADPYCGFPFTASGYREFFGGLLQMLDSKRLHALPKDLPVLLIGGDRDPIGDMGKSLPRLQKEYQKQGMKRVDMKLYKGARHELFNETNRDEVTADLLKWLDQLGGKEAGKV